MSKLYRIIGKDSVTCQSLTFGYLYDIEEGVIKETILGAIIDGSNLDEDGVRALTRVQANEIWEIIKKETYPELYDEDGNELTVDIEPEEDKKKA